MRRRWSFTFLPLPLLLALTGCQNAGSSFPVRPESSVIAPPVPEDVDQWLTADNIE